MAQPKRYRLHNDGDTRYWYDIQYCIIIYYNVYNIVK